MIIYVSHNVLTEEESPLGYFTLRCIRSYLELDMWTSLEVHTTETIAAGRQAVLRFSDIIKVSKHIIILDPVFIPTCIGVCSSTGTCSWV